MTGNSTGEPPARATTGKKKFALVPGDTELQAGIQSAIVMSSSKTAEVRG
jgi:hypothetical protein